MKYLLQYGIQRSSTNYLEGLLLRNYQVRFLNDDADRGHPLHKHFRLYDNKEIIGEKAFYNNLQFKHFQEFLEALKVTEEPAGVLIVSKDPYSWLISYKRWVKKFNWPEVDFHYIEEYNQFYGKWMEFAREDRRILFIRYADLLEDPLKILMHIEEEFSLDLKKIRKLTGRKGDLRKVARSKRFSSERRNYYLHREYLKEFDEAALKEVNLLLDRELLDYMQYPVIESRD